MSLLSNLSCNGKKKGDKKMAIFDSKKMLCREVKLSDRTETRWLIYI